MRSFTRTASVFWLGTRQRGEGFISTPCAGLKMTLHATGDQVDRGGTNPLELMAAAHASSFSLTLAHELGQAGYPPHQIHTMATVTMESAADGWTLTQIHLDVVAAVAKVAECDFVDAALRARANCPVSRVLNTNVSMRAKLNHEDTLPQGEPTKATAGIRRRGKSSGSRTKRKPAAGSREAVPPANNSKLK